MKRVLCLVLAILSILTCFSGCSKKVEYVPDYADGMQNHDSDELSNSFFIKQDDWIYYGIDETNEDTPKMSGRTGKITYIVKAPVYDLENGRQTIVYDHGLRRVKAKCTECGEKIDYTNLSSMLAVVGDWVYLVAGDSNVVRMRIDGRSLTDVLCFHPTENIENKYLAIMDDWFYYLNIETVQTAANTWVSTYHIKRLDLATKEIEDVEDLPFEWDDKTCDAFVFDGSLYLYKKEPQKAETVLYSIGSDEKIRQYDWAYTIDGFGGNRQDIANYEFLTILHDSNEIVFRPTYASLKRGFYCLKRKDLINISGGVKIGYNELTAGTIPQILKDYSLENTYKVQTFNCLGEVEDGLAFSTNDGQFYYSFIDREIHKINDDASSSMGWIEDDEKLYYEMTKNNKNGIYRVNLDGTEWEDISWMYDFAGDTKNKKK